MFDLIKKLLGMHCHSWEQWKVTRSYAAESAASVVIIQARVCKVCGLTQLKKQSL